MIELEFQEYVEQIKKALTAQIKLANKARSLKYDPYSKVESIITPSSTDNILAILNLPGLENYLPERINEHKNLLLLAADVAKQIVNGRFSKNSKENLILIAVQSAFVILSRGQCSVPKEYVHKVRIDPKQNYLTLFFTNTIRYVPGSVIGLVILISDYLRGILHLNRFHSSPETIGRYEEELEIFLTMSDRVSKFNSDHLRLFIQNIGIELSSDPYERIEVQKYRNLPKITNHLRMGLCVTLERVLHNLQPIIVQKLKSGIPEWEWLDKAQFISFEQNRSFGTEDIRSTQPLLSQSNQSGGFRLRYGESRTTGFGTIGIHPVTMALTGILTPGCTVQLDISDNFYAINPVSSIMGPLVELEDGSLKRINKLSELRKTKVNIKQIWEMGDLLISISDIPISTPIVFSAWTEEWWKQEIDSAIAIKKDDPSGVGNFDISKEKLDQLLQNPLNYYPTWDFALILSKVFNVPLHPRFSLNWNELAISDFILLIQKLKEKNDLLLPADEEILRIIKQLGVPFEIIEDKIQSEILEPFIPIFRDESPKLMERLREDIETITVESLCQDILKVPIRSLCYRRIGFKLIRVEKSEPRFTNPPHHVIFPLGKHGGPQKDFFKLPQDSSIKIRIADRYCNSCDINTFTVFCPECKQQTNQKYTCRDGHTSDSSTCSICEKKAYPTKLKTVNINGIFNSGLKKIGTPEIKKVKGISYLDNSYGVPESLIKGILRAEHDIFVFKDGTSRFSYTNSPIRFFSPNEINTSISELQRLGYAHDIYGKNLTDGDQLIEIFPYDIIINEEGMKFIFAQSKFLDDELTFQYNTSPYYRLQSHKNVIGSLIVGIAPTSQIGVIGRIIGYSNNKVLFAHPLWHLLKSRSCNGVTDSITLLLDVLLNFSREFIPTYHGGAVDVPSVINLVDSWTDLLDYSIHNSSVLNRIFYQELQNNPKQIDLLSHEISLLTSPEDLAHSSNDLSSFSMENQLTEKKVIARIKIALNSLQSIRGVEEGKYVDKLLINDFLIKISKSISRFFRQPIRCKFCKTTYRRVPLSERCPNCNNKTLELTLSKGWVLRYLHIINQLYDRYTDDLSEYTKSWIRFIELNKNLLFDVGPQPTTLIFNDIE
ncbi:MAG: hypothetical protein ACXABU_04855 [Candidatus Hodarchaeales archaeon]|jgi:DNA polymerase II large subunit